ncbi:MAG: helix-turn-helix transcriptional regulator [Dehalococcoidales bacterium]
MIIKTRIFELNHNHHQNLSGLAQTMGLSVSQIYRVRQGKRSINQKFIIGAIKAFPGYKLDELFYFAPESPIESTRQALGKFTSATEYMPSTPRATPVPS